MLNNITITSTLWSDTGILRSTCELIVADWLESYLEQEVLSHFATALSAGHRRRVGNQTLYYCFDLDTSKITAFLLAIHTAQLKLIKQQSATVPEFRRLSTIPVTTADAPAVD
ncbi:hypothetical protein GCM10027347_39750 [Larkinella harenae]